MLKFISTLNARKNRLLTRAEQQLIGESLILENGQKLTVKSFFDFSKSYADEKSTLRLCFKPLLELLASTENKRARQNTLLYGVILHAMVDNLDAKHAFIRDRKSYPNKLSRQTRNDVINRLFKVYLPEIKNGEKYWKV